MSELRVVHCVPLKVHSVTRKHFMYMDSAREYHADSLLQKYGVHARFNNTVYVSPDNRYRFVTCSVPKKEVELFKQAISELPDRMELLGYSDYRERWDAMMKFFEENRGKVHG